MKQTLTLGIIGGNGWLGSALGRAVLSSGLISPNQLVVTASHKHDCYQEWSGVTCVEGTEALQAAADIVVVSVRPEQFGQLTLSLENRLVISLMAKVPMAELAQATGSDRIVRAMPNAAVAIRHSYTPWCATPAVGDDERLWVQRLFAACGVSDEVGAESQIDYLTALTGSGPAFPALLADALISHAVSQGINSDVAQRSVLQTLLGGSQLMLEEGASPMEMVARFLDYGGTTSEGLNTMLRSGFKQAVHHGVNAAHSAAKSRPY